MSVLNFRDTELSVKIPNTSFTLKSNTTYRIIGREDTSTPMGYRERGITKLEHPMNGESAVMSFDTNRKIWDTGLYTNSPCYSKVKDSEQISETVEKLTKYLVPHLINILPEDALSYKSSNNYWDSYSFPMNQNLTISTNTPEKFFGMWIALISGKVAPEDDQKNPVYRENGTPYIIINSKEKADRNTSLKFEASKATFNFMKLLDKNKETLIDILTYSDMKAGLKTEDSILNSQFINWIGNKTTGLKKAQNFNQTVEKFDTPKKREELEIWKMLKKGVSKGEIKLHRSEYFVGDVKIGNNLKVAAKTVNEDKKLKILVTEQLAD